MNQGFTFRRRPGAGLGLPRGLAAGLLSLTLAVPFLSPALAAEKPTIEPYGFVRLDAVVDDSRMQNHQYAMWVLSEDAIAGPENDAQFTLYPRLTRLGLRVPGFHPVEDVEVRGQVEVDFQNGGSESRETPRLRHGYLELLYQRWSFLAGQTWDLISPLYPGVNADGLMWNAGNLGDRRPQTRVAFRPALGRGKLELAAGVGATGAIDRKDLDGNGSPDGPDAGVPMVEGRIGIETPLGEGAGKLAAGVWSHWATEQVNLDEEHTSWSVGIDLSVPVGTRVKVEGEGWVGSNLSDVRGGVGMGVNPITGEEIRSRGGWGQIVFKASDSVSLFGGLTLDNPDNEDLVSYDDAQAASLTPGDVGRSQNRTVFAAVRVRPWPVFQFGLEYLNWTTEYLGLADGQDQRVNAHWSLFF